MKRKYIPLKDIEIYDDLHKQTEDGFVVDVQRDGQTTEQHREGIDYIKSLLVLGEKILPILVVDMGDRYIRLDGFKRCLAHLELGRENIEAFICTEKQYLNAEFDGEMRCWHGGQDGENGKMPLLEDKGTVILFQERSDGLRIERAECYHVHFGYLGRYRLTLGEEDFIELAKAITWES